MTKENIYLLAFLTFVFVRAFLVLSGFFDVRKLDKCGCCKVNLATGAMWRDMDKTFKCTECREKFFENVKRTREVIK